MFALVFTGVAGIAWYYLSQPLLVMLQGTDLQKTIKTVERFGGEVTHELPIIDAIGAELNRGQLLLVEASSPEITRVIDDLAWKSDEDVSAAPVDCPLSSGIELRWSGSVASWDLYNKGGEPVELAMLELELPETLGELAGLSLQGDPLPRDFVRENDESGKRTLRIEPGPKLAPRTSAALELRFNTAPAAAATVQNEMSIVASIDDACRTKLVPSYPDPAGDSYYPNLSGAASLHRKGITGKGVTVAVLDSGLWESNEEIALNTRGKQRVVARYDAIRNAEVTEAFDESGHGTHMTSVIARSGAVNHQHTEATSYRGIAPDANIVAIKAFGGNGEAGFLDIVRGIQWIVNKKDEFNISVLNLSFAATPRWPYWDDPVNQAVMRAWQAGLFIVAAAGNEGPEPMTIGSPGNLPYVLTVGAMTDSWTASDASDDYIPDFSSRGPTPMGHIKPDIVAPGGHIAGITRPTSTLMQELPEYLHSSGDFVMTGSSQATALVSGLAALLLQISPDLSNDELKCMFVTSAKAAIELDGRYSYSPFVQGTGLVDVGRAVLFGRKTCEQDEFDLASDLQGPDHYRGPAVFDENALPALPGQDEIIAPRQPAEGPLETRRWGAEAHLNRLEAAPEHSPIDWPSVYHLEQKRLNELAAPRP